MPADRPRTDQDAAAAPRQRASRSVTAALALTALLLVLVLSLAAQFIWRSQSDARAAAEARAASAAYVASTHARWLIEANLQALRRIDESLGDRPDLHGTDRARDLDTAVAALPGAVHVWVFDADGNSVLTDEPELGPARIGDRDYFLALKTGTEWHIGALVNGRRTTRKVFPIGRRIERGGEFLGAAVIYVPADLLAQFWRSMDLGPGSTVGLLRDDGWLVARFPVPESSLNLANYVLFTEHLPKAPEGSYEAEASPADGRARIVGYRRVDGLPLVTVVGIPSSALAEGFRGRLGEIALVAAPIGAALLLVSLWVVRLLRQEERARDALAAALEDNRMLLREVHHRVKNNLQTVSSLIQLQPGDREGKDDLMRRIAAMSAVHEHIYGSDQFGHLDIADYIRRLVGGLRDGYGSAVRVQCDLEPVKVSPDQALPLGLIVNEVVSNAFKHAFPDGRPGLITVTLKAEDDGRALLRVRDDGVGYQPGRATGMGSRLIRGLVHQIEGNCEFQDDHGTVFVLDFPLADLQAGRAGRRVPGAAERAA
ncbi:ATP-binding protein (plasmid) [Skermanella mucosa]|uniref:sensor histidine kinase n=1 Tax=Skermanella mucosa TaxID=1789672 RepID=UPI00192BAA79|nr:histidine kinase dimerization/phosphoacceptor domain -containing protein [Skermanella mucosa]UEM24870.1 ATP-binding protein [Skermanella mucosa]